MPNTVQLTVSKQITRNQLVAALDKILHQTGCTACGLLGHGIILQGDPAPFINEIKRELTSEPISSLLLLYKTNQGVQSVINSRQSGCRLY